MGLVCYLMLATLPGPGLCCCTVSKSLRLFDRTVCSSTSASSGACCCQRAATKHEGMSKSGPKKLPPGDCPCKQLRTDASLVVMPDNELTRLQAARTFEKLCDAPTFAGEVAPLSASDSFADLVSESIAFPHLSPQQILRSLHILRC